MHACTVLLKSKLAVSTWSLKLDSHIWKVKSFQVWDIDFQVFKSWACDHTVRYIRLHKHISVKGQEKVKISAFFTVDNHLDDHVSFVLLNTAWSINIWKSSEGKSWSRWCDLHWGKQWSSKGMIKFLIMLKFLSYSIYYICFTFKF